jgi:KaiC/GvpD/RAD55 family RecA-like ATPase
VKNKLQNLKSGISAFDESLGGLPAGSIILFLGEADTGMTTCAQQILYQGLRDGRPAVYFTTGRSWEDVVAEMSEFGWGLDNYFDQRKMWFIDSFGMRKDRTEGEVSWDIGPANLLAKEFPRVVTPLGTCTLVVDNFSDVVRSGPFPAIEATLKTLQAHVRATGSIYLLLANKGIHSDHVENTVKRLSDGVVDLSTEPFGGEEYARKMRVVKMPGPMTDMKVYAYRLGPSGIELAELHRVK